MAESQAADYPTREWGTVRFADVQFRHRVPAVKWDFFVQQIRPLADGAAETLWSALFAGVGRPFHPQFARGWMGQFFRQSSRSQGSDLKAGEQFEEGLCNWLGWEPSATAFLVCAATQVYAASWSVWLDCFHRGWVPLDTSVLCSESSTRVAVFWEGFGPYFARRGARKLTQHAPNHKPG